MIGIVVVSHDNIATEMVATTKKIIPEAEGIIAVAINSNLPVEANRQKIAAAIDKACGEKDDGVLLLTDMFGGTPSNLCLSFLGRPKLEVIGGINLPMLIKLVSDKKYHTFEDVVKFIQEYGQKNIVIASSVLEKNGTK